MTVEETNNSYIISIEKSEVPNWTKKFSKEVNKNLYIEALLEQDISINGTHEKFCTYAKPRAFSLLVQRDSIGELKKIKAQITTYLEFLINEIFKKSSPIINIRKEGLEPETLQIPVTNCIAYLKLQNDYIKEINILLAKKSQGAKRK